jgi:cytochrome c553
MKKVILSVAAIALAGSMGSVVAGDAAAGKAKSVTCIACHGANGVTSAAFAGMGYPNLAGQNAKYIETQLKAFKAGQRTGGMAAVMAPMAAPLTDEDMANLGAYYESLK